MIDENLYELSYEKADPPGQKISFKKSLIVKCDYCRKPTGREFLNCPHCGGLSSYGLMALIIGVLISGIVGILFFLKFVVLAPTSIPPTHWQDKDNSSTAYVMIQDHVKDKLVSPTTAQFPHRYSNDVVISKEGYSYLIVTHVDAQNHFGAYVRTPFVGEIVQIGEYEWRLNEIIMR